MAPVSAHITLIASVVCRWQCTWVCMGGARERGERESGVREREGCNEMVWEGACRCGVRGV